MGVAWQTVYQIFRYSTTPTPPMGSGPSPITRSSSCGAEEAGMKGWREGAADIFTKHGEIAAKMKSAPGPVPSDFQYHFLVCQLLIDWARRYSQGDIFVAFLKNLVK